MESPRGETSCLIVTRFPMVGAGLSALLETQLGLAQPAVAATAEEALSMLAAVDTGLVLLDTDLPETGAKRVLQGMPAAVRSRTLLMAGDMAASGVADLLRLGAGGAIAQSRGSAELLDAVRSIRHEVFPIDSPFARALVGERPVRATTAASPSAREAAILSLVRRGFSSKSIAGQLRISEPAVKAGLQRLFHKYGVHNRAGLVSETNPPV
jgi:DNA-binding NarL/FixJ family response regulator